MYEKKFSTRLLGSMSDENRTKNHESNTRINTQNVEFSHHALYLIKKPSAISALRAKKQNRT